MHIGRLGVRLFNGKFVLEDFVIEGLEPGHRPFLTAKRIDVSLAWDAMFRREVLLDSIEMTDWHMVLEQWAGGKHSFPKFNMGGGSGPRRFVTTMQYVRTKNGTVTFDDHGSRWGTVARNLDITVTKFAGYRGEANFHGGTVWIQDYVPMSMSMTSVFRVEEGIVHFERMNLITDGAVSNITGDADIKNWPEMTYKVKSTVDFKRMRELFFAQDDYTLSGEARFNGVFHLFKGGRALTGDFESDVAGLQIGGRDYEFPKLRGRLGWFPNRFEVTDTTTGFYGGEASLTYSILSSGKPGQPSDARFDAEWRNVDLADYSDFLAMEGVRLAGRWSGRNLLQWPLGRFRERSGDGYSALIPPAGAEVLAGTRASQFASGPDRGGMHPAIGHLPVAGEVSYRYDQHWLEFSDGRFSTPDTDVTFSGRTAWGDNSRIPFHVSSTDLQESDRVLAAMMTAFGAPTNPITVGGTAEFSGVMTESLSRPRVEGHFVAEDMRAFDVTWGDGEAGLVIQNSYADVSGGRMQKDGGEITVNGRFSLGFPRRDKGEEINGRIRVTKWSAADFKHAFDIEDYNVEGIVSGEYHLYGPYQGPFGFGTLTINDGLAYGEPFETATGSLRFEGNGVRIDGIQMRKSGGTADGAAFVGWNGTYSFNATGRRIPLESVKAMAYPQAPLTGLLEFNADGSGTFEAPRYQFRARIRDLFVADEGVGEVTGRIEVRGDSMRIDMEAASPRLAVSGTGRIDLTAAKNADVTLRFTDTSLDPYARAFEKRISPFTTAVGSGTLRVIGELANPERLVVDVMFDQLNIRTFDYPLRNAKPIRVLMSNNFVRIDNMQFVGDGTELDVTGTMDLNARRVAGLARGSANLGILQGVYRDIRSSGNARADRTGQRLARCSYHSRPRDHRERPPAVLLAAALARRRKRHDPVRLAQHQARRPHGTCGRRPGELRWPRRARRLCADGSCADRHRTQHAPSVSRRYSLGNRRGSCPDWPRSRARPLGAGHRAERRVDNEVRHRRQSVRFRRRERRRNSYRRRGAVGRQNAPRSSRRAGDRARHASRREQRREHRLECRPHVSRDVRTAHHVRQRGDLARRVHLRRAPLRRDARAGRFHEPCPYRADLRHRRGDAGPRAPADLSRHAERVRDDAAAASGIQLGSAVAAGRRRIAAARRPCDR